MFNLLVCSDASGLCGTTCGTFRIAVRYRVRFLEGINGRRFRAFALTFAARSIGYFRPAPRLPAFVHSAAMMFVAQLRRSIAAVLHVAPLLGIADADSC